ncbi:MAG: hypothetical protein AAFX39_02595 [Pseudomonadota bacterium]
MVADMLRPAKRRIRQQETDASQASDLLLKVYDRLPELMGRALAGPLDLDRANAAALAAIEISLIDDVVRLIRDVLDLGIGADERLHAPSEVRKRLDSIAEIIEVYQTAHARREATDNG